MIIRIGDISPKSRHNTPILLYMFDKMGHIGKLATIARKTMKCSVDSDGEKK
jgi:hypothetical protein